MTWTATWFAAPSTPPTRLWRSKRVPAVDVFTGERGTSEHLVVDLAAIEALPSLTVDWLLSYTMAPSFGVTTLERVAVGEEEGIVVLPVEALRAWADRWPHPAAWFEELRSRLEGKWLKDFPCETATVTDYTAEHVAGFTSMAKKALRRGAAIHGVVQGNSGRWFLATEREAEALCETGERNGRPCVSCDDDALAEWPGLVEDDWLDASSVAALFGVARLEALVESGREGYFRVPGPATDAFAAGRVTPEDRVGKWREQLSASWNPPSQRFTYARPFVMDFTLEQIAALHALAMLASKRGDTIYVYERQ
jgi:hypothetical protein